MPGTASMKYVTVSYVWGAEVSDGPDQFGRLQSTLPDLITGVMKVVIALGYRYLWIDRYCIPQTDSSGVKLLLIQNMDKIYSQFILTIIAATTKCPSEGLAGITRPRVVVQEFLQLKCVHLVQWVSNFKNEIECSMWNTRGWSYQEALLSLRRLVFTEETCYFQCDAGGDRIFTEGSRMESIDYDLKAEKYSVAKGHIPIIFPSSKLKSPDGHEMEDFEERVNEYAHKQLSKDSDVLPGFLGILGMFTSKSSVFHGHIYGVPILEPRGMNDSKDPIITLIAGIVWNFNIKCRNAEDIAAAAIPSRRRILPSWIWCDWIHASPSLYSIAWKRNTPNTRLMRWDMVSDTALSLEFEDGTILPWPRECDISDLTKKAMSIGNVRIVHVVGWFTHFSIPDGSCARRNDWGLLKCGPYLIDKIAVLWLRKLAKEQTMNGTNNKEYVFKAWVIAPTITPHLYSRRGGQIAYMILLGETSDLVTFERIEVFEVFMEWIYREYWRTDSVKHIAEMFEWEKKAFRLA